MDKVFDKQNWRVDRQLETIATFNSEIAAISHSRACAKKDLTSKYQVFQRQHGEWIEIVDKDEGSLRHIHVRPGDLLERLTDHDHPNWPFKSLVGKVYEATMKSQYNDGRLHLVAVGSGTGWTTMQDTGIFRRIKKGS